MTVASEAFVGQIVWTGETTFNPGFSVEKITDVNAQASSGGVITALAQGIHYTVTLGTNGAVTINFIVANMPAAPQTVTAFRVTPALQGVDFQDLQDFSADDHEMLHDRWARCIAELRGMVGQNGMNSRLLRVPFGEFVTVVPPLDVRKNRLLGFDNNGNPVMATAANVVIGGPFFVFNDPVNGLVAQPITSDFIPPAQLTAVGGVKAIAKQTGKALVGLDEGGAFVQEPVNPSPYLETDHDDGTGALYNILRGPGSLSDAGLRSIWVGDATHPNIFLMAANITVGGRGGAGVFGFMDSAGLHGWTINCAGPVGTANVLQNIPRTALAAGVVREQLTANRSYFVATTGLDTNDGLTAGTPFLTIQKAIDVMAALDMSIFNVTINVAAGTYAQALILKSYLGAGPVAIVGAGASTTTISAPAGTAVTANSTMGRYIFNGFRFTAPGGSLFNLLRAPSQVDLQGTIDLGPAGPSAPQINLTNCSQLNIQTTNPGGLTISGGGSHHVSAAANCTFACAGRTNITFTGSPAFSVAFLQAIQGGIVSYNGNTFVNTVTGQSASVATNAVIDTALNTNTAAAAYLPGNHTFSEQSGGVLV
jgi:hypothetical protein